MMTVKAAEDFPGAMTLSPLDHHFEARVRASFARQRAMDTIGAVLTRVEPGIVEVALPYRADLTQQHGFLHAGIVATILDSACGYAAFSLMADNVAVLTIEYKINLLRPARGDRFVAKGLVVKAGQTITVCSGEAFAHSEAGEKLIATMQATVFAAAERDDLRQ